MISDPKQGKRIVDRDAIARKMATEVECRSGCGRRAETAHHLVQRGAPHFGDDVEENIVGLCGHGTAGCHGAHHGSPYVDDDGRRWDADLVNRGIGVALLLDEAHYIVARAGEDYLRRIYYRSLS